MATSSGTSRLTPETWKLTDKEDFASFSNWKNNIVHKLKDKPRFKPFLQSATTWTKKSGSNPNRGLTPDTAQSLSAEDRCDTLEEMLGIIAANAPHFLQSQIIDRSTSLDSVWQVIRKFYGFQQSEATFLQIQDIRMEEGERPQRLYYRLLAHVEDNLLKKNTLMHDGELTTEDEEMTPTVERMVVSRWMELIHPDLGKLVRRTYAADFLKMTVKDLQNQISLGLEGFLAELKHADPAVNSSRMQNSRDNNPMSFNKFKKTQEFKKNRKWPRKSNTNKSSSVCHVCDAAGRPSNHTLKDCRSLTYAQKKDYVASFKAEVADDENGEQYSDSSASEDETS